MQTFSSFSAAIVRRLGLKNSVLAGIFLLAGSQAISLWSAWNITARIDPFMIAGAAFTLMALYLLSGVAVLHKKGTDLVSRALERLASGDFSLGTGNGASAHSAEAAQAGAGKMWESLVQMSANILVIINQVQTSAERISYGAKEIAAGYTNLSQRTEEQASTLEETAASMEELSATIKHNADSCSQANMLAEEAQTLAEQAADSMRTVTSTMDQIQSGSTKMSEIVALIEGVAFQTNILALNAAVEAARAGEQGRGFAVVASEVRNLAQRSAAAAEDIKRLIGSSIEDVSQGAVLVNKAEHTVDRSATSVREVFQLIDSVATASGQQNIGVQAVSKALAHLETATQQNAALVEQGSAVALSFEQEAIDLVGAVSAFKSDRVKERDHAVSLVKRGITHLRAVGADRALADFNNPSGNFADGEAYLYVFNMQGVLLASPFRQDLVGVDQSEHTDHDGKKYVQEILRIAKTMRNGWYDYRSTNPISGQPEAKSAYIEREGDLIIGCGIYRRRLEADASPSMEAKSLTYSK